VGTDIERGEAAMQKAVPGDRGAERSDGMNDWQPARIVDAHLKEIIAQFPGENIPEEEINKVLRKPVRVRPYFPGHLFIEESRLFCNAERFFEIHPNDLPKDSGNIVCEHMILTD
jgi:hypothetical protein